MGDIDLELYDMGLIPPLGCLYSKTAPRPYDNTSAEITVSVVGSNNGSGGAVVRLFLTSLKALCHWSLHSHVWSLRRSAWSGLVLLAMCGENLLG